MSHNKKNIEIAAMTARRAVFEWEEGEDDIVSIQVNDDLDSLEEGFMYPMTYENRVSFPELVETIQLQFQSTTHLDLGVGYFSSTRWIDCDDAQWIELCQAISKTKLRHLTVQISSHIVGIPDHRMGQLLEHLPLLEKITFLGPIPDDNYEATFQQLPSLPHLKGIEFEDDCNSPDGFVLYESHFTKSHCQGLVKAIVAMCQQLVEFRMEKPSFEDEADARRIVDALCCSTTLQQAYFCGTSIFQLPPYFEPLNAQLNYITALNRAGRGRIDPTLEDLVDSIVQVRGRVECIYYFVSEHAPVFALAADSSSYSDSV